MRKLLTLLLISTVAMVSYGQIIYTFDAKTPVYENDLLLGTDSATLQTSNFKVSDIGGKILDLYGNNKVIKKDVSVVVEGDVLSGINALPAYTVGQDEICMYDVSVTGDGSTRTYILTKGKGNYGSLQYQLVLDDIMEIASSISTASSIGTDNVFVDPISSGWAASEGDDLTAVLNTVNTIGINSQTTATFNAQATFRSDIVVEPTSLSDNSQVVMRTSNTNGLDYIVLTAENDGAQSALYRSGNVMLDSETLVAGTDISLVDNGSSITVNSTGASSVIAGTDVTVTESNGDYTVSANTSSVVAGTGISVSELNNVYTVSTSVYTPYIYWNAEVIGGTGAVNFQAGAGVGSVTVTRTALGRYTVTHPFSGNDYTVHITGRNETSPGFYECSIASDLFIRTYDFTGTLADKNFMVSIIQH